MLRSSRTISSSQPSVAPYCPQESFSSSACDSGSAYFLQVTLMFQPWNYLPKHTNPFPFLIFEQNVFLAPKTILSSSTRSNVLSSPKVLACQAEPGCLHGFLQPRSCPILHKALTHYFSTHPQPPSGSQQTAWGWAVRGSEWISNFLHSDLLCLLSNSKGSWIKAGCRKCELSRFQPQLC